MNMIMLDFYLWSQRVRVDGVLNTAKVYLRHFGIAIFITDSCRFSLKKLIKFLQLQHLLYRLLKFKSQFFWHNYPGHQISIPKSIFVCENLTTQSINKISTPSNLHLKTNSISNQNN